MTDHPTTDELLAAATGKPSPETATHLEDCRRCQVLLARLRDAHAINWDVPAEAPMRLIQASPTIAATHQQPTTSDTLPTTGDVWRTQAPESLLVWVRKPVSERTIDVIPLTLDADLADDRTLIVKASETPWGCDAAVFVDTRTHVHVDALESKLTTLDLAEDVQHVIDDEPQRTTRATGTPMASIEDQRLEYREALRRGLDRFAPSSWGRGNRNSAPDPETNTHRSVPEDRLNDRIPGLTFLHVSEKSATTTVGTMTSCRKVECLDAVVLICRLDSTAPLLQSDVADVARASRELVASEHDATAVAVFQPTPEQPTALYRRSDMRSAIGIPSGETADPGPYLFDLPLVDALFKHFDGYDVGTTWFGPERLASLAAVDLGKRASRHAAASADTVAKSGRAAIQPPKKAAFGRAHEHVSAIEAFVEAVARGNVEQALAALKGDETP
jgi:hypothetical protein